MKESTKKKRIEYFTGLIKAKQLLIESYRNLEYKANDPDWIYTAEKMIKNWQYKIKAIEDTPVFTYKEKAKKAKKYEYSYYPISVKESLCIKCLETKPAESFGRNKHRKSGLSSYCLDCYRKHYGYSTKSQDWKNEEYKRTGKYNSREEMLKVREERQRTEKERSKLRRQKYANSWGSGVYLATTTGGRYVGFSSQLRIRRNHHNSKSLRPDSPIAGIFTLLKFEILETTTDKSREQYWIDKLKPEINQRAAKKF